MHMPEVKGKRVFVGLSGGVDSAVCAALQKQSGASLVGVFIQGWYPPGMPCTWADDRRDAMRVAAHLGIPFHTLDASAEYKKGVIDYLLSEYALGRTPNPDIMCNRDVKFGAFYNFAKSHGADFIATGHYARAEHDTGSSHKQLLRGVDASKDQSYFLWAVPQETFDATIFPLGDLEKKDVRKLAERFNLPVASKKDSQGICFLGSISVDDFLREEFHPEPGKAVDENGTEIGRHNGALLYTIGERAAISDAPPGPWYVVKKDMQANTITVSRNTHTPQHTTAIPLTTMNWFEKPVGEVFAQYRYHGPLVRGTLHEDSFTPTQPIDEPLASGQSLVVYDGERCMGGGIIA